MENFSLGCFDKLSERGKILMRGKACRVPRPLVRQRRTGPPVALINGTQPTLSGVPEGTPAGHQSLAESKDFIKLWLTSWKTFLSAVSTNWREKEDFNAGKACRLEGCFFFNYFLKKQRLLRRH
ncbi:hypothetical protein CEXT_562891 [Caerostris extrusa]|uniref:Uncharacterized protein n=1 Tax=Caerostris extrusa TaxID=172846 RepID=A0AAV4WMZ5_CAEEX|nr:hypothetical protein CEXT_562891 [Caerostris extrusa]